MTSPTPENLSVALDQWDHFTWECAERGFGLTGDDYTYHLDSREWLEDNINLLTPDQRQLLAELDSVYLSATTDDGGALLSKHFNIAGLGWWWRRRPNKWGADLAQDWPELEQGAQAGAD